MLRTLVPSVIRRVCAAANVSASTGSMQRLKYSGSEPSGVAGYGVRGASGYSRRSATQSE